MVGLLPLLVALIGSAQGQKPLPLSSISYPTAPLLPIAPLADYGNFFQRASVASSRVDHQSARPVANTRDEQYHQSVRPVASTSDQQYQQSRDLCDPTPCGPNTRCSISTRKNVPVCRCIDNYIPDGHTINGCIRPECLRDSECPRGSFCNTNRNKCEEVCFQNACGFNADCSVGADYRPLCRCRRGYEGNPDVGCTAERIEPVTPYNPPDPCATNPCGSNALCKSDGNRAVCECLSRYEGDPISGCTRVECVRDTDCYRSTDLCRSNRCINPCSIDSICGRNSDCTVRNRQPVCSCLKDYYGDARKECIYDPQAPCKPSPCGRNTNCEVRNGVPVCTCLSGMLGNPLTGCNYECERDSDCSPRRVCQKNKCVDPCAECGQGAQCDIRNGVAICRCPENYLGSPYTKCYPECVRHEECSSHKSCENYRCVDPCKDACGTRADCRSERHKAICSCPSHMTGDPLVACRDFTPEDLCKPNPCGVDAECNPGFDSHGTRRPVCTCPHGYIGEPLTYCRKGECVDDSSCPSHTACFQHRCQSTCIAYGKDVCGINADCRMQNHRPICSCPSGYRGDPISHCRPDSTFRYTIGRARKLW